MCGRFVSLSWDEVLGVIQSIEMDTPFNPEPDWPARRPDAFPKSIAPIIVPEHDELVPLDLRWGFAAPWDERKVLFNTRIETALGQRSGVWREAIEHGRCIVPTFGFFEPSATETVASPRTGKLIKKQYEFALPGRLTLLAGVRNEDAFSVVTTEPNRFVAQIHARMPIVLEPSEVIRWLSGDFAALADRSNVILDVTGEQAPGEARQGFAPTLF